MRRRLTYLAVWSLATAVAVGVSCWGVRPALFAAASGRHLSAAELRRAMPSPAPSRSPSPSPSPSSPAGPSSAPDSAVSDSAETGTPSPPAAGGSPTPGWVGTPDPRGSAAMVRTFALQGGQVTVFCALGDVRVIGTVPVSGFTLSESRQSADSLRVALTSARHTSQVWVAWRDGCYAEVSESV